MSVILAAVSIGFISYEKKQNILFLITATAAENNYQLSNPKATAAAKSLYSYLCDTYGN